MLGSLNKLEISIKEFFITPKMLASIINMVNNNELSLIKAKEILYKAMDIKKDPMTIIEESNFKQINNEEDLIKYVKEAIEENEFQKNEYLTGKEYIANFFVGKVMQKTNKGADPKLALKLIKEELEKLK